MPLPLISTATALGVTLAFGFALSTKRSAIYVIATAPEKTADISDDESDHVSNFPVLASYTCGAALPCRQFKASRRSAASTCAESSLIMTEDTTPACIAFARSIVDPKLSVGFDHFHSYPLSSDTIVESSCRQVRMLNVCSRQLPRSKVSKCKAPISKFLIE
jgi:hypothetical protein